MSAQIAPASLDDSAAFSNGGSSTTNGSSAPSSKKHVFSRFLKKRPPDLYGQRHAIESSKCLSDSLRLLEKEINKLSESKRRGIEHARVVCPEIFESKVHPCECIPRTGKLDDSRTEICCMSLLTTYRNTGCYS